MKQLYYGILLALLVYLKLNETQTKKGNFRIAALVGIIYILYQLFKNKEGFECTDHPCAIGARCISSPSPAYCYMNEKDCKYNELTDEFCNLLVSRTCTISSPEKYKETAGWGVGDPDNSIQFTDKTKSFECFEYGDGFLGGMFSDRYKSSSPNSVPTFECDSSGQTVLESDSPTCEKADWLNDGWFYNIFLPVVIAVVAILIVTYERNRRG